MLDACTVLGGYGPEFRAMIQFAAWTGVRAGELYAMQSGDIDGDYLWVRRSRKTDGSIGKPKIGRERKIAFVPPAQVLDDVPRRPDAFLNEGPGRGATHPRTRSPGAGWRPVDRRCGRATPSPRQSRLAG